MSHVSEWLHSDGGQQVTLKLVSGEVVAGKLYVSGDDAEIVRLQLGRTAASSIKVPVTSILYWTRGVLPTVLVGSSPRRGQTSSPMSAPVRTR